MQRFLGLTFKWWPPQRLYYGSIAIGIEELDGSKTARTNFVRLVQSNCTTGVFPGRDPCFQSPGGTHRLTRQYKVCTVWFCNRDHIRFLSQSIEGHLYLVCKFRTNPQVAFVREHIL